MKLKGYNILFIANNDWANLGFLFAKALKSVGVEAFAVSTNPLVFYSRQAHIYNSYEELVETFIKPCDVIIWMHSQFLNIPPELINDKVRAVFHGGTSYRQSADKLNDAWNKVVHFSIIQTTDLLGLGAKNEKWVLPPVDIEYIDDSIEFEPEVSSSKPIVAHYSRHPIKGTDKIVEIMAEKRIEEKCCFYNNKGDHDAAAPLLMHDDNLRRMYDCHIYVETINPFQFNKPAGVWGLTALEAGTMRKVVVTNFRDEWRYKEEYGTNHELIVANDFREFKDQMIEVLSWDLCKIKEKGEVTRQWVLENHSLKAVGKRLDEKIYEGMSDG